MVPTNKGLVALIAGFSLVLGACGKIDLPSVNVPTPTPTATPNPSNINNPTGPNPPVGTVDNTTGFYVRTVVNPNYTYVTHAGDQTPTAPCIAQQGQKVDCYIEAAELDLYYNGAVLQYNIPSNMCTYFRFMPYFFYQWKIGNGPGFVQQDTDAQGNVGVDPGNTGTVTGPVANCQSAPNLYDYTLSKGPNCCVGTYTFVTRAWNKTTNTYTVTSSQTNVKWGGDPSLCIAGPAVDTQAKDKTFNFPEPDLYYVSGTGLNKSYTIASPVKNQLFSDIYPANYFNPADNGGNPPAPMYPPNTSPWNAYPQPNPYYDFQCLDIAGEKQAEIRVYIRKWNTGPAFLNLATDPSKFNMSGFNVAPWSSDSLDNFQSWLDFKNNYPQFGE